MNLTTAKQSTLRAWAPTLERVGIGASPGLTAAEKAVLEQHSLQEEVEGTWLTSTRVDTGLWLWRPVLRLLLTPSYLILLAPGPRPFYEKWDRQFLELSHYNHLTGELILGHTEYSDLRPLRLPPLTARRLTSTAPPETWSTTPTEPTHA